MRNEIMRLATVVAFGVATLGAGGVGAANATVYDVVSGFSSASNPDGVWSYSYAGALFTDNTPFNASFPEIWWTGQGIPLSAYVTQNVSGSTITTGTITVPNNTLWLDPESWSNVAVTFTAPTAGTYNIAGDFLGIDTTGNLHGVEILSNSSVVFADTIVAGETDSFSLSASLAQGGTISFIVESPGSFGCSYCYLSTGLQAQVSSGVPEPATWAMMLLGFCGLGLAGFRASLKNVARAA